MNYRHKYHAGNFADVVKHVALTLAIERLKQKDAPFRVIDTHAGIGMYELDSEAAIKTGEWHGGIGRLIGEGAEPLPAKVARLLKPYLDAVMSSNPSSRLIRYPGSPSLARALLRPQDTLVVNELHEQDAAELRGYFGRDKQTKVMELDGWTALKALLPPKERRGIVLVDPPFEQPGEFRRLAQALVEGTKRFATGVFLLWYPIKDRREVERFKRDLEATGLPRLLAAELMICSDRDREVLSGTGLAILNPPFGMEDQLSELLRFLADRLAVERGGGWLLERLSGEG